MKKTIIFLLLSFSLLLTSCDGEARFKLLDTIYNVIFKSSDAENYVFETILYIETETEEDRTVIEARMAFMGIEVISKEADENGCSYKVHSDYPVDEEMANVLISMPSAQVLDKSGNILLTADDIEAIENKVALLYLSVSPEYREKSDLGVDNYTLEVDGTVASIFIYPLVNNEPFQYGCSFDTLNIPLLQKVALSFRKDTIAGNVTVTIEQESKSVKIS